MSDQGSGGGTKEIKFSFVVDQASAQSVMKTLKDLTDQAEKFAKALQGAAGAMNGGGSFFGGGTAGGKASGPASTITKAAGRAGAGGGGSAITNVVMENAKAFKSMASMSGDALKSMQDILKKSVDDQKRSIGDLDKTITSLGKSYQQLKKDQQDAVGIAQKLGINPALLKSQISQKMSETGAELAAKQGEKLKATADLGAMGGAEKRGFFGSIKDGWQQGGLTGALGANVGSMPGGPWAQGIMNGMGLGGLTKLAVPALAVWAAKAGFEESRENSRRQIDSIADRGRVLNPVINQLRSGDTSFIAKQRFLLKDKSAEGLESELMAQATGAGAKVEALQGQSGGILSKIVSAVGQGAGSFVGADVLDPRTQTELMRKYIEHVNKVGDSVEFQQTWGRYNDWQSQTSGTRMAVARAGGAKREWVPEDVKDGAGNVIGQRSKFQDRFVDDQIRLMKQGGFTKEEEFSAEMQMMAATGSKRYGNRVMSAAAAGYGQYGGLLAQSSHLTGDDRYANLALGGGINKAAGMQLGSGVMSLNQFGLQNSEPVFAAMQASGAFTGKTTDFAATNMMMAGVQAGNNAFAQGDNYQKGQNLLGAINALGSGSNYRQQDYLAGLSITELMSLAKGQTTPMADALGVTSEHAKKMLDSKMNAGMNLNIDVGGTDKFSQALSKFQKSGKGFMEYTKGLTDSGNKAEADILGLGLGMGKGMGEAETIGLSKFMSGAASGKGAGTGFVGAGKLGAVEQAEADAKAEQYKKNKEFNEEMSKVRIGELANAEAMAKSLQSYGTNMGSTIDTMVTSLSKLDEAVNLAAQNMTKLMDPKDAAKFRSQAVVPNQNAKTAPVTSKAGAPNQSVDPSTLVSR